MTRQLVIFGTTELGELAHYYFSQDPGYRIVAFTADAAYIDKNHFKGLPVIPFEDIARRCPPETHDIHIALGYTNTNAVRKARYLKARELGYRTASHVSPRACVAPETPVGENTLILEGTIIQPFVRLGNNLIIWSGAHIGHHSHVEDHCFIGPQAAIAGNVHIGQQSFIGINATLRDGVKIGERCIVGAGAIILSDLEAEGVHRGHESPRLLQNILCYIHTPDTF